jgi:hypothetical protein
VEKLVRLVKKNSLGELIVDNTILDTGITENVDYP